MNRPHLRDKSGPDPSNNRRSGRVVCQEVVCSLGDVLDISAGGMRLKTRRRPPEPGAEYTIHVSSLGGDMLLPCRTCWVRRSGLIAFEVGVRFGELDSIQRHTLVDLARACAHNETVLPSLRDARRSA